MSEKITPKSPELLQAQVAAFAAERIYGREDRQHIIENIGAIALGGLEDVSRTTKREEHHIDETGEDVWTPKGTEVTVASPSEYIDFLRSASPSAREGIEYRKQILEHYNQESFKPTTDNLLGELQNLPRRADHPAFLGSGAHAAVFRVAHEGKEYAARVPSGKSALDGYVAGAALGKNIPGFEQIVAASYEDGVIFSEIVPGKEMDKVSAEDMEAITDDQLAQLIDALSMAVERNIHIDLQPHNIFYDHQAGFGIIDYSPGGRLSQTENTGIVVGSVAEILSNTGFFDSLDTSDQRKKINLDVTERLRSIVESRLDGEDQELALEMIDTILRAN